MSAAIVRATTGNQSGTDGVTFTQAQFSRPPQAGDLLIAWLFYNRSTVPPAVDPTATGWVLLEQAIGAATSGWMVAIYTRTYVAGDGNYVFAGSLAGAPVDGVITAVYNWTAVEAHNSGHSAAAVHSQIVNPGFNLNGGADLVLGAFSQPFVQAAFPATDTPTLALIASSPTTHYVIGAFATTSIGTTGTFRAAQPSVNGESSYGAVAIAGVPTKRVGWSPIRTSDYVLLTWTGTSLGAAFLQYEIERLTEHGATWVRVANIPAEATSSWADVEARFGMAVYYRIRVRRADLSPSDWTALAVVQINPKRCELVFSSNENRALTVAYDDVSVSGIPNRDYVFLDAAKVVLQQLYGRDYQVAFRPTEKRGTTFKRTLLVWAGVIAQPSITGPRLADPLVAIAQANLSYVCVRDNEGNRFYAAIQVETLSEQPAFMHLVEVTITEVTGTPTTPGT